MLLFVFLATICAATSLAQPVFARGSATPLFAGVAAISFSIRGPLGEIARETARSTGPRPATLTLEESRSETHAIELSPRGITRRRRDVCTFPPLRIAFIQPPARTSLFHGQRRLKLVTHCRQTDSFQQYLLLEYAAYRMFDALTPLSFRVRLASISYFDGDATQPFITRLGFLIEDVDDAAERNGLEEIESGDFSPARLDPEAAARFAVFQYMIGNLDWAMAAGPAGDDCCHNSRPIAAAADPAARLIPIPYDFDHAGMVAAPYATPPAQLNMSDVRTRRYRGFCAHNDEAQAAAAEMLAARGAIEGVFGAIPELSERSRSRALAYLAGFFENVATPAEVGANLLRTCIR